MGALEGIFKTRTNNSHHGTIVTEWDSILLARDLHRLIAEGFVEQIAPPEDAEPGFTPRTYYHDRGTGEVYLYAEGWERGSPEFRKYE